MTRGEAKLANQAWEALFRAQVGLARSFSADDIWDELSANEYDVLYTLSQSGGGLRIGDINRRMLLTQAGLSRLVARLEDRGFVTRCADPRDRRAARITLTPLGAEVRKRVGRRHARAVTEAMTRVLGRDDLAELRDLCHRITAAIQPDLSDSPRTGQELSR